jgi:hypothetical protein
MSSGGSFISMDSGPIDNPKSPEQDKGIKSGKKFGTTNKKSNGPAKNIFADKARMSYTSIDFIDLKDDINYQYCNKELEQCIVTGNLPVFGYPLMDFKHRSKFHYIV